MANSNQDVAVAYSTAVSWSMTGASKPRFPRKLLEQKMINKAPLKHAHDDEVRGNSGIRSDIGPQKLTSIPNSQWSFNTQCSSQWDGFRHYAYQKEAVSAVNPLLQPARPGPY